MCVLIHDKYPKARIHGLVIARDPALQAATDLRPQHLPLLLHMRAAGEAYYERQRQALAGAGAGAGAEASGGSGAGTAAGAPLAVGACRLGFHSVPSMRQLHLHVVSDDFHSDCLKNKKHWNSFATPFFLPLDSVVAKLEAGGKVEVDRAAAEALLKQDLRCHRCGAPQRTMPALKAHIASCKCSSS